jgi:hypothetical protein
MFKLDMLAMFGSIIIIFGIYFWLQRKQLVLETGDVWQSVWENIVTKGLKKLDAKDTDSSNNWNPNIILFSGESKHRRYLLELSNTISGQTGIVTNFKLIVDKDNDKPLSRTKQIVKEPDFEKLGIFARQVKVDNIYRGIENIASTFGFSGIEPNSIMMGWPKLLNDSKDYSLMTEKLLYLDYNLLYLDFDRKAKFGKYQTVDFWWRETDNKNAEMMLNIARFILQSTEWSNAKIRVLFVNHNNIDNNTIKSKILKLVENLRVNVDIKVINNGVEQKPFYEIIAIQSAQTDLTVLGIPDIKTEKQAQFILNTNHLFESIGSTLLVKASNNFNEVDLDLSNETIVLSKKTVELEELKLLDNKVINDLVMSLDKHLSETSKQISRTALSTISTYYYKFIENIQSEYSSAFKNSDNLSSVATIISNFKKFSNEVSSLSDDFKENKLPITQGLLDKGVNKLINNRNEFIEHVPKRVKFQLNGTKKPKNINWYLILNYYYKTKILPNTQDSIYDFGVQSFILLNNLIETIISETQQYLENLAINNKSDKKLFHNYNTFILQLFESLKKESLLLNSKTLNLINTYERDVCNNLIKILENPDTKNRIKQLNRKTTKKESTQITNNLRGYASDWKRNQTLAHNQVVAELNLFTGGLSVFKINEKIKTRITESIIIPQYEKIKLLSNATDSIVNQLGNKKDNELLFKEVNTLTENIIHIDFDTILENEEDYIMAISRSNSFVVDLIDAESFNILFEQQNDNLESISLNLPIIQDHIIQSSYLEPLQENTQKLEKVYNQISEEIYNTANLIKHLIDDRQKAKESLSDDETLTNLQSRIVSMLSNLDEISSSFNHNTANDLHNTLSDLRVRNIIEATDLVAKTNLKTVGKTKIRDWYENKIETFHKIYNNVIDFIIQRQQDINSLNFDKKHNQYFSNIEQVSNFINSLQINSFANKVLPFYYKKLFTGSHIANSNTTNRDKELLTAHNAINRIDSGISGAIIVLGESLTGKTFFTESLSKSLNEVEEYQINPPKKQNYDINDLHQAFQKTFNKSGTTDAIIGQLKTKSVFIFNDLERWWIKGENGSIVINYLAKMIKKHGNKHYFLLNCNIHSYHVIRKTSQLEKQILSSILMSPFNKFEIKEIILNRHKIAGAKIWFENEIVGETKRTEALFTEIHHKSKGNIGIALNIWINSIAMDTDDNLFISKPKEITFPNIQDANWKLVLYQFLLHNKLETEQLQKTLSIDEIDSTLQEMKKAGLVYKLSNNEYVLENNAIHYIEDWLTTLKIIN